MSFTQRCRLRHPRLNHYATGLQRNFLIWPTIHSSTIRCHSDRLEIRSMADSSSTPKSTPASKQLPLSETLDVSWRNKVQLAENQDSENVLGKLETLLIGDPQNHHWYLCLEGKGIQRSFHFKTFKQTWEFMNSVAEKCKSERHHPEWWNVCIENSSSSRFCLYG